MSHSKQLKLFTPTKNNYSTTLNPQISNKFSFFDQQLQSDTIFCMASQLKRNLVKTIKKPTRNPYTLKNQSCFIKNQIKQRLLSPLKQTDVSFTKHNINSLNTTPSYNYSKSKQLKQTSPPLIDEQKLLSKITINRIRSQRQNIEQKTKKVQNQYKYLLRKIQKSKKKAQQIKLKTFRNQIIKQEHKREKYFLEQERIFLTQENQLEKSRLRSSIIKQKNQKQQSLMIFYSNRVMKANQIRQQCIKMDEQILKKQLKQLQKKRVLYTQGKHQEKQRSLKRQSSLQTRRIVARNNFKQKWLDEFGKNSKARESFIHKKQVLSKKMRSMLQKLRSDEENQQISVKISISPKTSQKFRKISSMNNRSNTGQIQNNITE